MKDPLGPIRDAYKVWKPIVEAHKGESSVLAWFPFVEGFIALYTAIEKALEVENEP